MFAAAKRKRRNRIKNSNKIGGPPVKNRKEPEVVTNKRETVNAFENENFEKPESQTNISSAETTNTLPSHKTNPVCFPLPAKRQKRKKFSKSTPNIPVKQIKQEPSILSFFAFDQNKEDKSKKKDEHEAKMSQAQGEDEEVFPLQGPGLSWYRQKGVNAAANTARSEERRRSTVIEENGELKGLTRGCTSGSIMENINELMEKLSQSKSERQQKHLSAMISVGSYILENGLIVKTQDLAKKYKTLKGLKDSSRVDSSQLLETVGKHLNIIQIYIRGTGYVTENHGKDLMKIVASIQDLDKMGQVVINDRVKEAIGDQYKSVLDYLDSKRDRDTLQAVLTKITSATFMTKLAGVQDKRTFQRAKDLVNVNLKLYEDMKKNIFESSQGSNDVAEKKKRRRILDKLKMEKLRHVFVGRGRDLKCEEFPDLVNILEFAFGESDQVDRAGGGLESHPRLTDTVLYRAVDNNTMMKHARETILALAPEGFNISLSSCFNYTQNYREGTYQAKRHHSGRGINACLSLHKPPRIGVEQLVINLHWSTQNVNEKIEEARPGLYIINTISNVL